MPIPLTARQLQALRYIESCEASPTFEEIALALGVRSRGNVHRLISALEDRGFVRRRRDCARSIEVIRPTQESWRDLVWSWGGGPMEAVEIMSRLRQMAGVSA